MAIGADTTKMGARPAGSVAAAVRGFHASYFAFVLATGIISTGTFTPGHRGCRVPCSSWRQLRSSCSARRWCCSWPGTAPVSWPILPHPSKCSAFSPSWPRSTYSGCASMPPAIPWSRPSWPCGRRRLGRADLRGAR